MNVFAIFFTLLSICSIGFSLIKPKYGALCYLVYMYLAPYLYVGGYIIYARTSAILFFLLFLFKFSNVDRKEAIKPLFPYIVFLLWNMIFVIFGEQIGHSFSTWTQDLSTICFLLFLYAIMCSNIEIIKLFKWTLFGICCIFTIYGLFLTSMPGINPYRIITAPMFGQEFNESYAAGNGSLYSNTLLAEGRLFGRISSFFEHPMTYGLNLGFFFIYTLYLLREKKIILIITVVAIFIAILTSGVRSAIAALGLTVLAILLYMHKLKYFSFGLLGIIAIIYLIPFIYPDAEDYIISIVNSDNSETRGSTLSMRIDQLLGSFDIVKDDILFGKGYGWTKWYNASFGEHPKVLWFESLVYCILINTGILGVILWGWFAIKYFRYAQSNIKDGLLKMTIHALFIYFIIYCTITGDFRISNMFVFYIVLMGINLENQVLHNKIEKI